MIKIVRKEERDQEIVQTVEDEPPKDMSNTGYIHQNLDQSREAKNIAKSVKK